MPYSGTYVYFVDRHDDNIDETTLRSKVYILIGLMSTFVFRAARDALGNNPVAQERVVGGLLAALAIADVSVVFAVEIRDCNNERNVSRSTSKLVRSPVPLFSTKLFSSLIATSIAMPKEFLFDVSSWNSINHANLTFVALLFVIRYVTSIHHHVR